MSERPPKTYPNTEAETTEMHHVTTQETPEQIELRKLKNYLESEVFPTFGLTKEDELRAITEAPSDRREVLQRSFENVRNSLQAFYEMHSIEGEVDAKLFQMAKSRLAYEALAPIVIHSITNIRPVLAKYGIDISLNVLGINSDANFSTLRDLRQTDAIRAKLMEAIKDRVADTGYKKQLLRLNANKEWLSEKQLKDHQFMAQWNKEQNERAILYQKINLLFDETGFDTWVSQTKNKLDSVYTLGADVPQLTVVEVEKMKVRQTMENMTRLLVAEKILVDATNFLCININPTGLQMVLNGGSFRDVFSLNEEELNEMKNITGRGDNFYLNQRRLTEEALGEYDPDKATIYGTYASKNGTDEVSGGAGMYGSIFLKLKRETSAIFCEGDSMSGRNDVAESKIRRLGIDKLDYVAYVQARQIAPGHVSVAKSISNVHKKIENSLGQNVSPFGYIEAHMKSLDINDIESINIPASVFNNYLNQDYARMVQNLQQNTQWKDRINIIEND